jgi:excisionase family DNA binding protein
MTKLLRVEEAAERLGLRPATIRKMLFRREIIGVKPTKRAVRIHEEDVEALCRAGYQAARRQEQP